MAQRTLYTVHNCHLHLSTLGLSTQCTTAPPPPPPQSTLGLSTQCTTAPPPPPPNPPWDFLRSAQPPPPPPPPPHPVPRFHLLVCCIMFTTKTGWWRPGNVAYLVPLIVSGTWIGVLFGMQGFQFFTRKTVADSGGVNAPPFGGE